MSQPSGEEVASLIRSLNGEGYWPTPLTMTSHPYAGDGPVAASRDYSSTFVGDEFDTSPYRAEVPEVGISTRTFIRNMAALAQAAGDSNRN